MQNYTDKWQWYQLKLFGLNYLKECHVEMVINALLLFKILWLYSNLELSRLSQDDIRLENNPEH